MSTWIFLMCISFIVIIYNMVLSFSYRRRCKKIKHLYSIEKTQSNFAYARYELILGVFNKQIEPDNQDFKLLYKFNTSFMRNTDKYREMNKVLRGFITEINAESKISKEVVKEDLGEHFKKSQELTAKALGNVIVDYSWKWKLLYKIIKKLIKDFEPQIFLAIPFISREIKEQVEMEINSHEAQKALEQSYSVNASNLTLV